MGGREEGQQHHAQKNKRSVPGIEPGTTCTRSRYHTSRPNGQLLYCWISTFRNIVLRGSEERGGQAFPLFSFLLCFSPWPPPHLPPHYPVIPIQLDPRSHENNLRWPSPRPIPTISALPPRVATPSSCDARG